MRVVASIVLVAGFGALFASSAPKSTFLTLGGDTDGYLSPCGCTKPMSGGIRRRATVIRNFTKAGGFALENGALTKGIGRQDQLKAEALAEALESAGASAINVTPQDVAGGVGALYAINNLAPNRLLLSTIDSTRVPAVRFREVGPFLVAGVSIRSREIADALGERDLGVDASIRDLISMAEGLERAPIVLLHGSAEDAASLAKRFPRLRLIQYRSSASPAQQAEFVGETMLVSPGEKGKAQILVNWTGAKFAGYRAMELYPDVRDDEKASRTFTQYLRRVTEERLLDQVPRVASATFAGNKSCMSCHQDAAKVWMGSKHAGALATLQKVSQHRDPDCTGCHVVGLDKETGYRDETRTPQLKNVGCESCHGPGAKHAAQPTQVVMGKVGQKSCAPCHVRDHSPNFNFAAYWRKIAH